MDSPITGAQSSSSVMAPGLQLFHDNALQDTEKSPVLYGGARAQSIEAH